MIINQSNLSNFFRGLRVIFDQGFQAAPAQWTTFAMRTSSTGAEEEYGFLGSVPGLKELLGEVTVRNLTLHNFTIKNREFEDTVGIKRKDLERDKLGLYTPLTQSMAEAAKQFPDQLLGELVCNGFGNNGLCYTGKPFFSVGHVPPGSKANVSRFDNLLHEKISSASYAKAKTLLRSRKNAEGRALKLGRDFRLVVGPKNEDLAKQIVTASLVPQVVAGGQGGATPQTVAVENIQKGTAKVEVFQEMGAINEDAWFLAEMGMVFKPFIVQVEVEPQQFAVTNENDSHVVLKKEFLFQTYTRQNAGYGMPELIVGSDGTV